MGASFGRHEGIIGGLTKLVIGPGRNPDSRTKYRINVGGQDLLVLTDVNGGALIVKQ